MKNIFILQILFLAGSLISVQGQIKIHDDNHISIGSLTKSFGLQVDPYGYTLFEPSIYPPYAWMNLTHAPNAASKCYIVQYEEDHTFFVYGNGYVWAREEFLNAEWNDESMLNSIDSALMKVMALHSIYYLDLPKEVRDTAIFKDKYGNIHTVINEGYLLDSTNRYIDQKYKDTLLAEAKRRFIGLVGREVEKVVPEVVRTRPNGAKSISYSGLTALLIEAIKEQQEQIKELQSVLSYQMKPNGQSVKNILNNETDLPVRPGKAILFQNQPNPFTDRTTIRYFLPEETRESSVYLFDLQGTLKMSFSDLNKGESAITIEGSRLTPGMYLYTLVVDGIEIETRRMILTQM